MGVPEALTTMMLPRLIRLRDAPSYLGMDRHHFNADVRPYLIEIPIGLQGIAFDRLDLDAWADDHKSRNGRPAKLKGGTLCLRNRCRDSAAVAGPGTSTRGSKVSQGGDFEKALAHVVSKRQSST